jgi:large subunit ribosomal protein L25
MADKYSLSFDNRTILGKKVSRLRREGILPATVYGKGVGPFSVQINARTFTDTYRHAGRTTLIELAIPGQSTLSAFVQAIQRHPVTRAILHVDLLVVDLLKEITVEVPIHLIGESPVVERGDALLNQVLNTLAVRALPAELPHALDVDISVLDSLDKAIYVRDISLPGKAVIEAGEDELVIGLTMAREEEEEEVEVEAEGEAEPELVREKREDEQQGEDEG